MKIKFDLTIFLIALFSFGSSYGQQVSGGMTCKVTGSLVISSEEGKSKRYSHIKDSVKEGDEVILKYIFSKESAFLGMSDARNKDKSILTTYVSMISGGESQVEKKPRMIIVNAKHDGITFSENYIRVETLFGKLFLTRYYRNDWHGIFSFLMGPDLTVQNLTFDCRHTDDKMDRVYDIYNIGK